MISLLIVRFNLLDCCCLLLLLVECGEEITFIFFLLHQRSSTNMSVAESSKKTNNLCKNRNFENPRFLESINHSLTHSLTQRGIA